MPSVLRANVYCVAFAAVADSWSVWDASIIIRISGKQQSYSSGLCHQSKVIPKLSMLKAHEIRELLEWSHTPSSGTVLEGTCILPVKAPIGMLFDMACREGHLNNQQRWDRKAVETAVHKLGFCGIAAVVNLCNTTKYMKKWNWGEQIVYRQFATPGSCSGKVQDFSAPLDFLVKTSKTVFPARDQVIIVHCLHGINRTGALCVAFLEKVNGLEANEAHHAFECARGCQISRESCSLTRTLENTPPVDASLKSSFEEEHPYPKISMSSIVRSEERPLKKRKHGPEDEEVSRDPSQ